MHVVPQCAAVMGVHAVCSHVTRSPAGLSAASFRTCGIGCPSLHISASAASGCETPHHMPCIRSAGVLRGCNAASSPNLQTPCVCCPAVPSNISPEVVCSSVSELVRMAAAALISLYVYLNFKQGPNDLAADEVLLVYSTIAIHSCANADNAAALDQQMQAIIATDLEQHGQLSVWRQPQQQQLLAADEPAGHGSADALESLQFSCAQVGRAADKAFGAGCMHTCCALCIQDAA
eukprot:GHRQ01020144.1.p1 GENE.GHRQ01020144.1~~GHRQ01020144.1.p1  ORF type:complete len:234 (+),score=72.86 GHRQ01020144.1:1449-2150(+)